MTHYLINAYDRYATFWQYADSGPNPGDQDEFNGSLQGLKKCVPHLLSPLPVSQASMRLESFLVADGRPYQTASPSVEHKLYSYVIEYKKETCSKVLRGAEESMFDKATSKLFVYDNEIRVTYRYKQPRLCPSVAFRGKVHSNHIQEPPS